MVKYLIWDYKNPWKIVTESMQGQRQKSLFGRGVFLKGENLKLHNPSIKSIFRITSLIYFRCIKSTD